MSRILPIEEKASQLKPIPSLLKRTKQMRKHKPRSRKGNALQLQGLEQVYEFAGGLPERI